MATGLALLRIQPVYGPRQTQETVGVVGAGTALQGNQKPFVEVLGDIHLDRLIELPDRLVVAR
ncbi:hypothetical protein [Aquamicrobium defluvii]|uniref:Uncharacterized protein n=1 Tax=Aquamicrobium defluvii TaxID=69279 RepID=A0A011UTA5_9HYPH|nr:hypothetical protein [Aquamicrobium defluvii]EXL09481.1 hypothetical protein BG36_22545 [Aquamicrobium defluvii]